MHMHEHFDKLKPVKSREFSGGEESTHRQFSGSSAGSGGLGSMLM